MTLTRLKTIGLIFLMAFIAVFASRAAVHKPHSRSLVNAAYREKSAFSKSDRLSPSLQSSSASLSFAMPFSFMRSADLYLFANSASNMVSTTPPRILIGAILTLS